MIAEKLQTLERIPVMGNDFRYCSHVSSGNVVVTFWLYNKSLFVCCIKKGSSGILFN
jgi:hypothetical protein